MSGMIKVKDPESGFFVPNQLVQSFEPSQYYAEQSQFDEVCGTSEVKVFLPQGIQLLCVFAGERVS